MSNNKLKNVENKENILTYLKGYLELIDKEEIVQVEVYLNQYKVSKTVLGFIL